MKKKIKPQFDVARNVKPKRKRVGAKRENDNALRGAGSQLRSIRRTRTGKIILELKGVA